MLSPTVMTQNYGLVWTEGWAFAPWVNEAMLLWQQNVVATQPAYSDAIARAGGRTRRGRMGGVRMTRCAGACSMGGRRRMRHAMWVWLGAA